MDNFNSHIGSRGQSHHRHLPKPIEFLIIIQRLNLTDKSRSHPLSNNHIFQYIEPIIEIHNLPTCRK